MLIGCNKLFPWITKNTDRNDIDKQNTHPHTKHSEKYNHYFINPSLFLKKYDPPGVKSGIRFESQTPPPV